MTRIQQLSLAGLLAFGACQTGPPAADFSQADAKIDSLVASLEALPSLTVAVVQHGRVVWEAGYGVANRATGLAATPETSYYIASATKPYVATLAALLDAEGVIGLEDPITDYEPYASLDSAHRYAGITVQQLLTHHAPITNGPLTFREAYSGDKSAEDIIYALNHGVEDRDPGYRYDNMGYNMYTLIVEAVLQKPWQDAMQERLFGPLGLKGTTAYASVPAQRGTPESVPYLPIPCSDPQPTPLPKRDNTMQSAGGMMTTAHDMATWLAANLQPGKVLSEQVLATIHQAYAPADSSTNHLITADQIALGWRAGTFEGHPVRFHSGGFGGSFAHMSFMPDQDLGIVVLTNELMLGMGVGYLLEEHIYRHLLGQEAFGATYDSAVAAVQNRAAEMCTSLDQQYASLAARPFQLSQPLENYTGSFHNPLYGTLHVSVADTTLRVELGNMQALGTGFPREESIRLEMVPMSGSVAQFQLDENGQATAVRAIGETFERVD